LILIDFGLDIYIYINISFRRAIAIANYYMGTHSYKNAHAMYTRGLEHLTLCQASLSRFLKKVKKNSADYKDVVYMESLRAAMEPFARKGRVRSRALWVMEKERSVVGLEDGMEELEVTSDVPSSILNAKVTNYIYILLVRIN
jgi:hypothetical protein